MSAAQHPQHGSPLENWQAIAGLATAVLGLVYVIRKPAAAAPAEALPSAGPAGFGEVGGGGAAGGVSPTSGAPASPKLTGQQSGAGTGQQHVGAQVEGQGQLVKVPPGKAQPGESQNEYEQKRLHTARPGLKQQTAVM